jgi:hypothetical protein
MRLPYPALPGRDGAPLVRYDQVLYTGSFSRRIVPVILARARALGLPLR